jgi:hypothetical protein
MSDPITYSFVLKSVNGLSPLGVAGVATASNNNVDLYFYSQIVSLLSRIKSDYNCSKVKMEYAGGLFLSQLVGVTPTGIDIVVSTGGGLMNTIQNTNTVTVGTTAVPQNTTDKIIACVNPAISTTFTISSSEVAYKTPIYIFDIDQVSHIRISLYNSLTYLPVSTASTCPSYSIMLKFTPIL